MDIKILFQVYQNSVEPIAEAAKLLEGELFPTASCVIPFLDQIFTDLGNLTS